MLLQTLVQLNILLMAAPALAGWVTSPVAHPMPAQTAQAVYRASIRQAEPPAPTVKERHASLSPGPLVTQSSGRVMDCACAKTLPLTPAPTAPIVTLLNPFPHATRAP